MVYTLGNDARSSPPDFPSNGNGVDALRSQLSHDVLWNTRADLIGLRIRNYCDKYFIPFPLIQEYWKEHPLEEFLKDFFSRIPEDTLDSIRTTAMRILTAVVITERRDCAVENFRTTFRKLFLDKANPLWNDDMLLGEDGLPPLDLSLPPEESKSLDYAISSVSVPVLEKSKGGRYSPKITLPITTRSPRPLGTGAYGHVYKVQIAAGCLLREDKALRKTYENKDDEYFAWKIMKNVDDGQRELEFARDYDKSTRASDYIMVHLTIIELGTSEASILYPLAQGDLQDLLAGKSQCKEWAKEWAEDDPGRLRKVIKKCYSLADGLEFLHNQLRNEGACFCRHGDIKPNNFLIFEKDWKIADMGLARVKKLSTDERGVRITTKTNTLVTNPYAAPEMKSREAMVGRSTDVWGLAAIIMELIIWGLGGPPARKEFEERRRECSEGFFYADNLLSKAVDDELVSWPKKYLEKVTKYLDGDEDLARQILTGLDSALRKAFVIDVNDRAKSDELMEDLKAVKNCCSMPRGCKPEEQSLKRLNISEAPAATTLEMLKRRVDEHLKHKFFEKLEPNERIGVSGDTEHEIKKWIMEPTPTAIAILTDEANPRLQLSAITHEVYFTARFNNFEVVKFLTLDRYPRFTESLKPGLDLVYCFIGQFMKVWKVDPQRHHLDHLAISDSSLSDETKFKNAVTFLGRLIQEHGQDRNQKPLIVIIDEFWRVCPMNATQAVKEQWSLLLTALGCAQNQDPRLKTLIRVEAYHNSLRDLGFKGRNCIPALPKQSGGELRKQLSGWLGQIV